MSGAWLIGAARPSAGPSLGRGLAAGAAVLAAVSALKLALLPVVGAPSPYLLSFTACLAAAWYGGLAAGAATTAVAALVGWLLLVAPGEAIPAPTGAEMAVRAIAFTVEGLLLSYITARLQVERATAVARQSDAWTAFQRLELLLEGVDEGITVQDADGRLVYANRMAAEQLGFASPAELLTASGGEILGRFEVFDEHGRPFPLSELPGRVLFRDGSAGERVVRFRTAGSEDRWSIVRATPIRDGAGRVEYAINLFRDISSRRRAEQRRAFLARASDELASSLDFHRTLATVAALAVPEMGDWCAVDVREGERVERLAVAHVDPAMVEVVREIERRWPPHERSATREVLRTGEPVLVSAIPPDAVAAVARDADHLALLHKLDLRSFLAVPMKRDGETMGVVTFALSRSDRRYGADDLLLAEALADRAAAAVQRARRFGAEVEARRELEEARRQAEAANQSKDAFLAILGHELRNPLAPILTALELLRRRGVDGIERERTVIERQVRHMVRLVDDLLDVSRITRGVVELSRERVTLASVVAKALEMAGPLVAQKRHEVEVDVPPDLEVDADPVRLAQVVSNLLSNAAKYTDPRGLVIVRWWRDGDRARLSVRDNGVGIAPDMLPRVFEPFVQEKQSLDRAHGGLGLGLAIARNLVALHGGTLTAKSDGLGAGSEFVLELPLAAPAPTASAERRPPAAGPRGLKLLLVDDNVDAAEVLGEALALLGHEVHRAVDGPSALALAARHPPDVALLDIGLPGMDGYELGRRLRALEGLSRTKLVALTGYGAESDRSRSARAGFDVHLVKPIGIEQLQAVLNEVIG